MHASSWPELTNLILLRHGFAPVIIPLQARGDYLLTSEKAAADDIQPPLYYVLVASWTRLAGPSEWALRFPSTAADLLTLPLLLAMGEPVS